MNEPTVDDAPRRTGRPRITTRRDLITNAREIGLPGLTAKAVSDRVGIRDSTFYRYFGGIRDLVTAVVDDLCTDLEPPDPRRPWPDYVVCAWSALAQLLDRTPGLAEAVMHLPDPPRQVLDLIRGMNDKLLDSRFPPEKAALGAITAIELTCATWLSASAGQRSLDGRRLSDGGERPDPLLRAGIEHPAPTPLLAWSAEKIELLITALATALAEKPGTD